MKRFFHVIAAALVLAASQTIAARAAQAQVAGIVDEVKFGILAHDIEFYSSPSEPGVDLNPEILFRPIFPPLNVWGIPITFRPHLGVAVNTSGDTSKAYAGLTMDIMFAHDVFQPGDGFFLDGAFGLAVHDGYLDGGPANRKNLGSRLLGRRAGELGYQINPQWSVAAFIDHVGNYGFAKPDAGLKTAGVRLGLKF